MNSEQTDSAHPGPDRRLPRADQTWVDPLVADWASRAQRVAVGPHIVAAWDFPPAGDEKHEPLLVVHGFPTSSFDYAHLIPALSEHRRVVLVDLLGFGLSDKPDIAYTMALQADAVMAVAAHAGLDRLALMTHDMGDTVGGELLRRNMDGEWDVEVTRRVLTNGSIYIDMAQLTAGQQLLLSLPDERGAEGPGVELLAASLVATLAPSNAHIDMAGHAELVCHAGGDALLPRTIRYVEERRSNERRFTGAVESHPAPVLVVWGPEDPIAVATMVDTMVAARPDAAVAWIEGAGHYPMVEDPEAFLAAVLPFLS